MYLDWTKHLKDEEEVKNFKDGLMRSRYILDRLKDILADREKSLSRNEQDENTFDVPNWEHRQAFRNGRRSELNAIRELIDLDKKVIRL